MAQEDRVRRSYGSLAGTAAGGTGRVGGRRGRVFQAAAGPGALGGAREGADKEDKRGLKEGKEGKEAKEGKLGGVNSFRERFLFYLRFLFILFCFVLAYFVSAWVLETKLGGLVISEDEDTFVFRRSIEKSDAWSVFEFSSRREAEPREFRVILGNGGGGATSGFTATFVMFLAYDSEDSDLALELRSKESEIADRVNSIVSFKSYEDIDTSLKRDRYLKVELINAINSILSEGMKIEDIYFGSFLITGPLPS